MADGGTLELELPEKLQALYEPHRYKVVYGGRGKGGSWNIARALLIQGYATVKRILCTREIQRTIGDSVHQLLCDQIKLLKLDAFYKITDSDIEGLNGTKFLFAGLRQLDVTKLKSFEGCDIAWVEEAESISKKSWEVLIPTIRRDHSEIWINFNPQLDSDETYVRFIEHTPPDTALMAASWRDNPFFPQRLKEERQTLYDRCKASGSMEDYENIYEGKCRTSVDGAIYASEIREAIEHKRIRPVPYDPMLKVHTVWDLGFNDKMVILFVQRLLNQVMVIDFIEDHLKKYDWYVTEIKNKKYNLGRAYLPHDAGHESPLLAPTPVKTLQALGLDVAEPLIREDIEIDIKRVRQMFGRIYFDDVKAKPLIDHLKRYRRSIPVTTNEPQSPLHDDHSHSADALRYLCMCVDQMRNEDRDKPLKYDDRGIV